MRVGVDEALFYTFLGMTSSSTEQLDRARADAPGEERADTVVQLVPAR